MSVKQFPILFLLGILFFCACSDEDAKPIEAFFCPDGHHPHKIDLGLPSGILWSCCNVGASLPIEYGGFYSLGETSEKRNYSYSNFKFYVDNGRTDYLDPKGDISCTKYDVATVRMGMPWCIPDTIFAKELLSFCTWEWTEVQEVQGMKVTGPNGNQIHFPVNKSLENGTQTYHYWSSALNASKPEKAYSANIQCSTPSPAKIEESERFSGLLVRAVKK